MDVKYYIEDFNTIAITPCKGGAEFHLRGGECFALSETLLKRGLEIIEADRHLTSRSSRAANACACKEPTILEKSYCTKCGKDIHPPPA